MTAAVSKKDFAGIYGCSKPYVSQLVKAGRLVLTDGGQVLVDASLERLGATSDPSKAGVRDRWSAYRAAHGQPAAQIQPAPAADVPAAKRPAPKLPTDGDQPSLIDQADDPIDPPAPAASSGPTSGYQDARARREMALAEQEEIALMKERGRVLDAESTLRAVGDAHIGVRNELIALADRLTPLVTPETDARKVWQLISDECERLCERVQRSAQRMAAEQRAEVTA